MERGQAPADGSLSLATRGTTACGGCVGCSATMVPLVLFVSRESAKLKNANRI